MILDATITFTANFGATHFVFGWGTSQKLLDFAKGYGHNICLLTSQGASGQKAFIQELQLQAKAAGLELHHFPTIRANPDVTDIDALSKKASTCEVIVGLGGGSVLDAAKALAVVAPSQKSARDWLDLGSIPEDTAKLPTILLPTTAGTGSELSFGAILSNRQKTFKGGLRGPRLATEVAIVDPALTLTMPKQLTVETGFDIVTHAIESYLSRKTNSQSRLLSLQSIALVTKYLPIVQHDLSNPKARTALAYASSMMGLNLASVGTCLPHRLQYPIGGHLPQSSHPQGLAWIYPTWIKYIYPHASQDIKHLFKVLELSIPTNANEAREGMQNWLNQLGLSTQPSQHLESEQLANEVQGDISADPLPHPERQLINIYKEIFA
jgi:alcohol dehydrogenase class IV